MGKPAKDGAWVTAMRVVKIECTACGTVSIGKFPMNEREIDAAVREHINSKHGGSGRI